MTINTAKLIGFDLEIARGDIPEGFKGDLFQFSPLGITVATTVTRNHYVQWFGMEGGLIAPQMSRAEAWNLLNYLDELQDAGWTIVTWNGLSFDFRVLAEESDAYALARHVAENHFDIMFQVVAQKGIRLGLDKAARGLGLPGKMGSDEGEEIGKHAAQLWTEGQFQKVRSYNYDDALKLIQIVDAIQARNNPGIPWLSARGNEMFVGFRKLLTVTEAMKLPEPDTGWMSNPVPRKAYYSWWR